MTELLAVYAALVATASLSWQIYTWRRLNRVHMSVKADLGVYSLPSHGGTGDALKIEFKNDGGQPVTVAQIGGQYPHGEPWVLEPTDPLDALPVLVPAGEKQVVYVSRSEYHVEKRDESTWGEIRRRHDDFFGSMKTDTKMVFWVQLESGERFRSRMLTFRPGRDALEQRAARRRLLRR